jgi:hypothetical protein
MIQTSVDRGELVAGVFERLDTLVDRRDAENVTEAQKFRLIEG